MVWFTEYLVAWLCDKLWTLTTGGESDMGVLVVTGSSRGIGATVARLGAQQGLSVCINSAQS